MITVTEAAAKRIAEFLAEEEANGRADLALRIQVKAGGCSGLQYGLWLEDEITDNDTVVEAYGVRVVIDRLSASYLSEAAVHYVDTLEKSGFVIDNPNAQGTCACGNSFH